MEPDTWRPHTAVSMSADMSRPTTALSQTSVRGSARRGRGRGRGEGRARSGQQGKGRGARHRPDTADKPDTNDENLAPGETNPAKVHFPIIIGNSLNSDPFFNSYVVSYSLQTTVRTRVCFFPPTGNWNNTGRPRDCTKA